MSGSSGIRRRPWKAALGRPADDALLAPSEQEVAPSNRDGATRPSVLRRPRIGQRAAAYSGTERRRRDLLPARVRRIAVIMSVSVMVRALVLLFVLGPGRLA